MSFSEQTGKLVNEIIQAEYNNACDNWSDKFNSLHEGYAVLLEEIEETEDCLKNIQALMKDIWENVKKNKKIDDEIKIASISVVQGIGELAQVGAVLMKIKNTVGEKGNEN